MVTKQNRLQYIRKFVIGNVKDHPSDIGSLLAKEFVISRQAANKHLRRFVEEGLLNSTGNTKAKQYSLVTLVDNSVEIGVNPDLEEHIVWRDYIVPWLGEVTANVVRDYGVGIFKKLQTVYGYGDPRDALLELSKGKLTTSSQAHSGEGIFFTSRMFDAFHIHSGSLLFGRMNLISSDDWLIEVDDIESIQGTEIFMTISLATERTTKEVFDAAVSEFEEYGFTRTHVPIKLAKFGNEQLVSRSQAKRVLARFDRFKEVLLDFEGVVTIGPAFADEIFRVFPSQHPETRLSWASTSREIDQMISRAQLADSS